MPQVSAERMAAVADWVRRPRRDFTLHDFAGIAEVMTAAVTDAVGRADIELRGDLDAVACEIAAVKRDIAAVKPSDLSTEGLPEAGRELEEVVAQTEEASNAIMSACEDILAADTADAEAYQTLVTERVTTIFEACAFQDLAGQRIAKVLKVLHGVDGRLGALAERLRLADFSEELEVSRDEVRARALLLWGPQARAVAHSQGDIDRIFSEVVSQEEIDRLFD